MMRKFSATPLVWAVTIGVSFGPLPREINYAPTQTHENPQLVAGAARDGAAFTALVLRPIQTRNDMLLPKLFFTPTLGLALVDGLRAALNIRARCVIGSDGFARTFGQATSRAQHPDWSQQRRGGKMPGAYRRS